MARDPFARATKSVLRRTGKDALLRGEPAGKVDIEHGVEVYEKNADMGESVFTRTVATIESEYLPKQGDELVMLDDEGDPTITYKLGRLVTEDGYSKRYVAIPST
jgi:hypothetical protein